MPAYIRLFLLAHLLSIFLIGSVHAGCPAGDLNGDCLVDFLDFQIFTEQWLEPSGNDEIKYTDLDGVDGVNMSDLALFVQSWHQAGIPLVINEFMASNNDTIADPQGQFDDWIEIWNSGLKPIDVGGMFLTDNLSNPTKWRIPINMRSITTIPAGGYLLIWADQDTSDSGLHTNFKLDADGEQIGLFDKDGVTPIDSIDFPEQTQDISYGRDPESNGEIRFFAIPTPGEENNGAYLDEVEAAEFSHKRGFYDTPFYLTLATETKNAIIYYTLDGSEPYKFTGRFPNGIIYSGPIYINRNTCLRARAIKQGWKPSAVKTNTYILNASDAMKSLPVISLAGDDGKTFYEPDGVMAVVGGSYGGSGWVSDGIGSYNNMMGRGMAFERPVSFEWIMPEDNSGFQVDCGLRVHGSDYMRPRYTRQNGLWSGNGKIAFRLYFRDRYGPDWLEYPLFPFEVDRFRSIVIRAGHNDRTNPFIKDELIRRLQKDMGNVSSGGKIATLFINGEYKGYFNPCEHIKDSFCQEWFGSDKPWDVMTMSGIRDGSIAGWNEMLNYARNNDLSDDTHYQEMGKKIDIPAFIDYLILQLWAANWDWPQNNWSAAAEQSNNGIWRFFIWDAEGTFESGDLSHTGFTDFPSWASGNKGLNNLQEPISQIYRALKSNPAFRQTFSDRLYKHFYNGGALTVTNVTKRFTELQNEMLGVLPNMNRYLINTWVPNRLDIFLNVCAREGVYTFEGPKFSVNGAERYGGHMSPNDVLTIADYSRYETVYYTLDGSDPISTNLPPQDNQDDGEITILVAENNPKRVLIPVRPVSTDWNSSTAFDDSSWLYTSGSPGGVGYERTSGYDSLISLDLEESMYSRSSTCYIRIPFTFSGNLEDIDSAVLNIRYDDGFVAYLNGAEIARRNSDQILTWNSGASASHPDSEAVQFESIDISALLSNLRQGRNLLAIHGLNASATGSDFLISAELIAGRGDSGGIPNPGETKYSKSITLPHSATVKARIYDGGTWSSLSEAVFAVGPVMDNLRITEIMYNPQDSSGEFIELKNIGTESINLNLVSFTNGIDFTFPSLELAAGQYVILAQDENAFKALYGTAINVAGQYTGRLENAGERITLVDAIGRTILDFRYKDGWYPITDGEGFSLTIIDAENPDMDNWDEKNSWRPSAYAAGSPGQDDSNILPNPEGVVINEVLAHSHAEASDWIELYNMTSTAIDIGGWYISDGENNLKKYQIANGTTIGPNRYYLLYEDLHFGNINDPGCIEPFALSENGEELYLSSAHDNILTGYRTDEDFSASETGVSFGRYYKSSTGNYNFVAMEQNTPGSANSYPKVGPIVISEIMYNPAWLYDGSYVNNEYEYIELYNISSEPVTLYNSETGETWRFTDGIEFTFPADAPVTIPSGGYLLIVKNPEAFSSRYPGVPTEKILGPYDGKLSDAGESLKLAMPGDFDLAGELHYIRVDRINYSDGSHPQDNPGGVDLWPIGPDGLGLSLTRKVFSEYGNDPANWTQSVPSPGE